MIQLPISGESESRVQARSPLGQFMMIVIGLSHLKAAPSRCPSLSQSPRLTPSPESRSFAGPKKSQPPMRHSFYSDRDQRHGLHQSPTSRSRRFYAVLSVMIHVQKVEKTDVLKHHDVTARLNTSFPGESLSSSCLMRNLFVCL